MVTLHTPQMMTGKDALPVMPSHRLRATRNTKTFTEGQEADCFIAKMSDGRYEVMDASFINVTRHFEVHTEESLHASFEEITK